MPVLPDGDYVFSDRTNGKSPIGDFGGRKATFDEACGIRGWVIS